MKLKNKKTGEIIDIDNVFGLTNLTCKCGSLKDLYDTWEDYKEEHVNYIIDPIEPSYISCDDYYEREELERAEELGIRFDSKEEAELAVRKLQAWKRLKDAGFKFSGCYSTIEGFIKIKRFNETKELDKDFDLLFGGEE